MLSIAERIDDPSLCVVHIGKGRKNYRIVGRIAEPRSIQRAFTNTVCPQT